MSGSFHCRYRGETELAEAQLREGHRAERAGIVVGIERVAGITEADITVQGIVVHIEKGAVWEEFEREPRARAVGVGTACRQRDRPVRRAQVLLVSERLDHVLAVAGLIEL